MLKCNIVCATFVSFRPISLDHTLFGTASSWFHVTNVLMHCTAAVLFMRVCRMVAGLHRNFATLAGVLFAVHPVHTEAVSVELRNVGIFFGQLVVVGSASRSNIR